MDFKMISARRILSAREDVCHSTAHVCSKMFCNPMSEADLIKARKLAGPSVHTDIFVCKYRQIHECGHGVCTERPKDGVCPKTGIYIGHPEDGFLRNPTYTVRKATATEMKRADTNRQRAVQTSFVPSLKKTNSGKFNFATALLGQDAMERTKEDNETRRLESIKRREELEMEREEERRKRRRTIDEEIEEEEVEREVELYGDDLEEEEEDDGIVWGKVFKEKQARRAKNTSWGVRNPRFQSSRVSVPFRKKKSEDSNQLMRDAENVVVTLFYSDIREKINEQKREDAADRSKRKIKAYKQSMKSFNKPWIVIDVLTIDANERMIDDHIVALDRDDELVSYFSSVIMRAWEIVNASPWGHKNQGRIKFNQHCLGVLYHMRRGYQPDDVVYIPKHEYMRYLPHVNDLKDFGFEKKSVKSGMKVIQDAYRSAKDDRWPLSKLRMHSKNMSMAHGKFI